ncbi:AGAP009654-PA, partial [Anopheles gambiae str. PEST]
SCTIAIQCLYNNSSATNNSSAETRQNVLYGITIKRKTNNLNPSARRGVEENVRERCGNHRCVLISPTRPESDCTPMWA